jgi:hypothetical protein
MKTTILTAFLLVISVSQTFCGSVMICGKISNFPSKKIEFISYPTDEVWLNSNSIIANTKTDKDGVFHLKIENINHFIFENTLTIGRRKIYLALSPGDSINIVYDVKSDLDEITFTGFYASKNYFMNEFESKYSKDQNTPDFAFDLNFLKRNEQLLKDYTLKYSIDSSSYEFINQYLLCNYLNYIFSETNSENETKSCIANFNLNNNKLEWYYLYYSVITGYLHTKHRITIELNTDIGFERAFVIAEQYLSGTIKENYQAYLIGQALLIATPEFIKSEKTKRLMNVFYSTCKDEYVKKNVGIILDKYHVK